MIQDFPGSPAVKTCASTERGKGSIPGGRTKIWHAIWCCQKKRKKLMTHAFELWCCRRLLRVPLTARRLNQSIQKKSTLNFHWMDLCWSSNTLAIWCEELTHLKRSWCWKRLRAGGEGDDRGWDCWIASPTEWTWSLSKLQETVKDREAWHTAVLGIAELNLAQWLNNYKPSQDRIIETSVVN